MAHLSIRIYKLSQIPWHINNNRFILVTDYVDRIPNRTQRWQFNSGPGVSRASVGEIQKMGVPQARSLHHREAPSLIWLVFRPWWHEGCVLLVCWLKNITWHLHVAWTSLSMTAVFGGGPFTDSPWLLLYGISWPHLRRHMASLLLHSISGSIYKPSQIPGKDLVCH